MMKKEEDIKQDVNMSAEESENTASGHAHTEEETVNETEKEPEEESAGKEEKDPMEALKEETANLKSNCYVQLRSLTTSESVPIKRKPNFF